MAGGLLEAALAKEQELMLPVKTEEASLVMRPAWKFSMQEALKREGRDAYQSQGHTTKASVRINEFVQDDSCLQRFVIPPQNKFQVLWSIVCSLLILWDAITIPLEMFNVPEFGAVLDTVGIFSFVFWMVDIPLHFFFGVQLEGTTELRPQKLAQLYLRSWFLVDLVVVLIDWMLFLLEAAVTSSDETSVLKSARYLRTLRLLRLFRLLRVVKLYRELSLLANRFLSTYAYMVMKVVAGLCVMLAINHLIACAWYGIGSWSDGDNTWIKRAEMHGAGTQEGIAGFADNYAASMHWALTQFTPATNNIAPYNAAERFFAIWVILLAMGVFSSFIGSISATVSSLRTARADQYQKQSKLLQFFIERDLSVELFGKVQEALKRVGNLEVRVRESEVSLIQGIPERFKMELHEEMYMSAVMKLGCWPSWRNEGQRPFFRNLCHRAMSEHVSTPGQDFFLPGADCQRVYVLQSGSMGYSFREQIPIPLRSQDVLCLPCLWAEWYHRGRLTSNAICYIAGVDCEEFCRQAINFGGRLVQFLQIYGILLVGAVEALEEQRLATDLSLEEDKLSDVASRAERFASMSRAANEVNDLGASTNGSLFVVATASLHTSEATSSAPLSFFKGGTPTAPVIGKSLQAL
ncbi:Kcnh7 [Symbiodinium sp. CCMP2592]|nr:Kcnh7 [Symbiodinium sp. CCMP2592]